ncbi:NADH-dependent flavin oxidoreductase [Paenibacillus elgii]|uniref:NADH-dependent flavin oxidoreductase n=1 Tax=Paenibacillus elgii TaxID=189691 RepID=UPI002041B416|nr:NADH-dependent flavin oxidoreductase [Paenibacillus elgii]MCM3271503.1 NADH-dependent flavin oxidoreductase [Paenibacillus elgii]
MNPLYAPLFEPLTLRSGITLDNRIVVAPMTHYSSRPDGTLTDEELQFIARRSRGAGMVITACAYIAPGGQDAAGEPAADHDETIPELTRWARVIQAQGTIAVLQLHHGGRNADPGLVPNGDVVGPSAIKDEAGGFVLPRELAPHEIEELIRQFGEAARRAIIAGFDGVEIHGAFALLLQQFYSPYANRRCDRWGGSVERRLAFPLAVIDEVKKTIARHAGRPFIVGYRFTPEEATTPGLTMADALHLADVLAKQELDYIHVLTNDYRSRPRREADATRTRLELIKEVVGSRTPVIGGGSIYTADQALEAYDTGIDLISLARGLVIDPDWIEKVKQGREADIETMLRADAQQRLVIPDPLWRMIWGDPGWFPGTS